MKRRIFWVRLIYCFFRLQIYEATAAIFWQSASYVVAPDQQTDLESSQLVPKRQNPKDTR